MKFTGLLFPGQGFQRAGILLNALKTSPEITIPILDRIDNILPDLELSKLLTSQQDMTISPLSIQPFMVAAGYTQFQIWKSKNTPGDQVYGIGHSLGEYTALACSNILSLESALKLVYSRGVYTSSSVDNRNGMMLIQSRTKGDDLYKHLKSDMVGAYNTDRQVVLTGSKEDLANSVKQIPFKVTGKMLNVPNAFHSEHMELAAAKLRTAIDNTQWMPITNADFKIISNVDSKVITSLPQLKKNLELALTKPVLWNQSIETLAEMAKVNDQDLELCGFDGKMSRIVDAKFHKHLTKV